MTSRIHVRNGKTQPAGFRLSTLASACVLAAGGVGVEGALAQSASYTYTYAVPSPVLIVTNFADSINSPQVNTGTGSATVSAVTKGVEINPGGAGAATPITVTSNGILAIGGGNQNSSSSPLGMLRNIGSADGIGMLAGQLQSGATIQALIDTAMVKVSEVNVVPATLVLSSNTISAATQLNRSDSLVQGALPAAGYTSTQAGDISASSGAAGITTSAAASVDIVTHQASLNSGGLAGSQAVLDTAAVNLTVGTTRGGSLTAPITVSGNTLAASYGGNQATSIFDAAAGSARFTGSVAVVNGQANIEGGGAILATSGTALVTDSGVLADVRKGAAGSTTLNSAMTVSDNAIAADSSGNVAGQRTAAGTILASNAIVFGTGNNIVGSSGGTINATNATSVGAGALTGSVTADVGLFNGQGNSGTSLVSRVAPNLLALGGNVTVLADAVGAAGSVSATGNTVAAGAVGNLAGNLISTNGTNFSASAAAASQQANTGSSVEAHTENAAVTVGVGKSGTALLGAVVTSQNTLGAKAEGNVAATTVSIAATHLTSYGTNPGFASADAGTAATTSYGNPSANGGISATNLQGNYVGGSRGQMAVLSGQVRVNATDDGSFTGTGLAVGSGASISLEQNAIRGVAAGNTGSTSVAASGTTGSLQAGVANMQFNDGGKADSQVTDAAVTAKAGDVTGAAITLGSNAVSSAASGNTGTNTLSASFSGLTMGDNANDGGPAAVGRQALANSGLGLANNQNNLAGINASSATNGDVMAVLALSANNSALTVSRNTVAASATANDGTNQITAAVGNLTTGANTSAGAGANSSTSLTGLVASNAAVGLAGNQFNAGAVTAANDASGTGGFAVVNVTGDVSNASNLAVTSNVVSAAVTGNRGSNNLAIGSTNLMTNGGTSVPIGGLASQQVNAVTGVATASVGGAGSVLGVGLGTAVLDSNVSVNTNELSASALGNTVTNRFTMAGGALATSAAAATTGNMQTAAGTGVNSVTAELGLVNSQMDSVSGGRTATVQNMSVGITGLGLVDALTATALDTANLSVQGNSLTAEARNNSATNTMGLTGFSTLASNAGLLNQQQSSTAVSGGVNNANVGIGLSAGGLAFDIAGSTLTVDGNASKGVAIGNYAGSTMTVGGTNLGANASLGGVAGATVTSAGAITSNADYGVSNAQVQTGNVTAGATALAGVSASGGTISGGSVSVTNNAAQAVAQANSAVNGATLTGTNTTGVTGAVVSNQTSSASNVTATALGLTGITTDAFSVTADQVGLIAAGVTSGGAPVTVSGNSMLASAGRNEAFNSQTVTTTVLSGGGAGTNELSRTALGTVLSGSDFTVTNVQADAGTTLAVANPGVIGATIGNIYGSSVTVSNNDVTAKSNVNVTSNALNLSAGSTMAATAGVNNYQASNGTVGALIGTDDLTLATARPINVGIAPPVPAVLNAAAATVSGNQFTAQVGGNTATNNVLNATAGASISSGGVIGASASGGGTFPFAPAVSATFAALNYQSNAGTMVAYAGNMFVGVGGNGLVGGAAGSTLTSSSTAVTGNRITASGYGNSASNAIGLSALSGGLNQASAAINNVQYSAASIASTVASVNVGVMAGGVSGGSVVVSGNNLVAQSMGNSSGNRIAAR